VDGVEVKGKALDEVVTLIRGELGTQVRLTISRASVNEPFEVSVTRAQINIFGRILKDTDIAYISMAIFNQTAPADIQAQLEKLLPLKPRALILDLRGNGGGLLTESIQIADLFLTEGAVASEKTASGQNRQFNAKTGEIGESIPLVVLVNGGSASASEIVAGAFQDRDRAVLIGQRTFGKGSVQVLHILSDGSQLRITNGAWYTPNETPLEHTGDEPGGLIPDVAITLPDPLPMGRDLILEAAIDYIYAHIGSF
ncbi:partial putative CtpA-like serine protease, partial [Anaerolineae bacterium]